MKARSTHASGEGSSAPSRSVSTAGTSDSEAAAPGSLPVPSSRQPRSSNTSALATRRAELVEIIRHLFVLFPAQTTVERIEGYMELLQDQESVDVAAACQAVVKVWTDTWVPPVGVIRNATISQRVARIQRERVAAVEADPPSQREGGAIARLPLELRVWTKLRKTLGRIPTVEEVRRALG